MKCLLNLFIQHLRSLNIVDTLSWGDLCGETTCYLFVTRPSTTSPHRAQAILIMDQALLGLANKLLPPNPSVSNPNNTQFYSVVEMLDFTFELIKSLGTKLLHYGVRLALVLIAMVSC